jgi:NADH-quinone oxidoreductase subunit L
MIMETTSGLFFPLVPLIVFLPVLGLLINIAFGGRMGEKAIGIVASLAAGGAFVVSLLLGYSLSVHHEAVIVPFAEWIHIGTLKLDWAFRVDTLSVIMMLIVSGVGTLIHIYAIGYMHEDVRFKGDEKRFRRFFVFLNLFIAMMMILVSGDSYMMLFVGWEGVGLCSFLLIGFWYDMDTLGRPSFANSNAAKKAFITNRVGDFGFILAAFIIFWSFGSFQFDEVFARVPVVAAATPWVIVAVTLLMMVGVAGKSAQIPLFVWLPDAMAGPTPVSALIHAATMVTAGVYLIVRSAPLFSVNHSVQFFVATLGAATALFAATIAAGQYDIKKVLAYSTISQLGFMVAAAGMGAYVPAIFHLATHSFFKALLFLDAGSIILGMERGHHHLTHGHGDAHSAEVFDPGDMRNMGGLRKQMPVSFWLYIIGALALAGIFPLAGFWSKDEILLDAYKHYPTIYWMLLTAAFFTAFYMGRQIWMVFFGKPRTEVADHAEESPKVMTVPLMVLASLSVLGGLMNLPTIFGVTLPGVHGLTTWLGHTLGEVEPGELNLLVAGVSTILALLAIYFSWLIYGRKPIEAGQPGGVVPPERNHDGMTPSWQPDPLKKPLGPVFFGMEHKWFIDEAYQFLFINPYRSVSRFLADKVDWAFWHDWFHDTVIAGGYNWISKVLLNEYADQRGIDAFANGLGSGTKRLSTMMRVWQNGLVRTYALTLLVGVIAILGYLILK